VASPHLKSAYEGDHKGRPYSGDVVGATLVVARFAFNPVKGIST
jgi:hypothetical protein